MREAGKGSIPRPFSVDRETFDSNWDRIFGKSKVQSEQEQASASLKNEYYDILTTEDCLIEDTNGTST